MGKLENEVALITGAASGMGKEIAILFASEGAKIVATDINAEGLEELKSKIGAQGGEIVTLVTDITSQDGINQLVDLSVKNFGTLDILVNNAGVMDNFEAVGDVSDELYERLIAINTTAPFKLTRKALEVFLPKGKGVIVNITSLAGLNGGRGGVAYTMSKHAANGLTKSTGYLYAKQGIRCNAIAPGGVNTNISKTIDYSKVTPQVKESIFTGVALSPRIGESSEIAKAALFLASKDSSFVNGEILVVDAGWNAY
jgi:NAD(P)-dependent dehydrogenase (short-subunit alcohol dehydrogenase family)